MLVQCLGMCIRRLLVEHDLPGLILILEWVYYSCVAGDITGFLTGTISFGVVHDDNKVIFLTAIKNNTFYLYSAFPEPKVTLTRLFYFFKQQEQYIQTQRKIVHR